MKTGVDSKTGKFYQLGDGGPVEITPREYYAIQFRPEVSTLGAIGEGYANRAAMPLRRMGAEMGDPLQNARRMQLSKEQHPFATGLGDAAAYVTPGFGLVGNIAAGVGTGAYLSDEGDALGDAAIGGIGSGVGDMLGRVMGRAYNALKSMGRQDVTPLARELGESGYQLSPGQKSGKESYQRLERTLSKTPQGQEITGAMGAANEEQLLKRANQAVGLPAGNGPLDRNARQLAHEGVSRQMGEAGLGVEIDVPQSLTARVSRIIKNDDMLEIAELPEGGTISGRDYMRIRTDLKKAQRGYEPGTGPEVYTGKTIKQMDDLFMDSATPEQAALYRTAREHEKNLILLEKGSALTSEGLVNPRSTANAMKRQSGYGPRSIQNALPETQSLIQDVDNLSARGVNAQIGQSGTPEGVNSLLDWKNWAQGVGAEKYYEGGLSMPGMLTPAPKAGITFGMNTGRGLLQER